MKKDEFKVGDTVYCVIFGKGKIIDIGIGTYPLSVEFFYGNSNFTRGYTQDGKYADSGFRTLFFEEIKIPESAYKRPKWRAEKGCDYFYVMSEGNINITVDNRTKCNDLYFKHGNYFKTEEEAKESKFYKVFHGEE